MTTKKVCAHCGDENPVMGNGCAFSPNNKHFVVPVASVGSNVSSVPSRPLTREEIEMERVDWENVIFVLGVIGSIAIALFVHKNFEFFNYFSLLVGMLGSCLSYLLRKFILIFIKFLIQTVKLLIVIFVIIFAGWSISHIGNMMYQNWKIQQSDKQFINQK
jgi:hypothetical protein